MRSFARRSPRPPPGPLSTLEARLPYRTARDRAVPEFGTGSGPATVCLAQSASRVVSLAADDRDEAAEWLRRYGVADRVTLVRGDAAVPGGGRFGLVSIAATDAAGLAGEIEVALRVLEGGGCLAFHAYPDPERPDVRRVVDAYAGRLGWKRVAQADYLAVFRTP